MNPRLASDRRLASSPWESDRIRAARGEARAGRKPNEHNGQCTKCGENVNEGEGFLFGKKPICIPCATPADEARLKALRAVEQRQIYDDQIRIPIPPTHDIQGNVITYDDGIGWPQGYVFPQWWIESINTSTEWIAEGEETA